MAGNIENELSQLKEQIKLLERMVYLKNNVSSSEEYITKYMETQSKLSSIMKNYNMDSYNHEKKLVELLKQKADIEEKRAKSAKERVNAEKESIKLEQETIKNKEKVQEHNEEIKKQNEEIVEQTKEMVERTEELTEREKERLEQKQKQDAQERLSYAFKSKSERAKEDLNKRQNEFAKAHPDLKGDNLVKELKKAGLVENKSNELIKDSLKSLKVGNKNIGELFAEGGKDVSVGAGLISAGVQTFNKAVQVFSNAVHEGFKKQTGSYENNFTNIATMSGMSKETYRNNQMALGGFGKNILHEQGLMNNIRTSDVQDMWNSLANKGLSQEDILASSLESVITKTIVPYLDVTTDEMQQFNMSVGDNGLLKQIRGISKISQEEFGSTMITQKYMQEALEYMSPMADAANLDLLKNTVGGVEMLQYLQSEEGGNLSTSAIAKLYKRTTNLQEDLMGSLSSGDLTTQLSAVGILANGINQYEDMAGVQNQSFIAQDFIKKITPSDANLAAMFSSATGTNGTLNWEILKKNPDLLGAYSKGMGAAGGLDAASQEVTNSLANDEFHTTKQLTEILAENLTNEVSAFAEMLGPWFDVLTTAVSGIATVLGAKLLGKVGGKVLGKIGGSAGKHAAEGAASGGLNLGFNGMGAATGVAGAATAVAGVAGTAYGAYKTYEYGSQFAKSGKGADLGATITAGAGTAAIAGGAITALTESGPIGWAIMAVGAIGLVAADLIEDLGHDGDIMEELNEASEQRLEDFRKQHYEERKQLKQLRDDISTMDNTTTIQQQMIEEGIISQEELKKKQDELRDSSGNLKTEQELNKEALIAVTDQYITTKASLDNTGEALLREIENSQNKKQNDISKDIWELTKKKASDMNDEEKAAVGDFMEDYYYWMKNLADNGDKDAAYRIKEWEKYGNNLTDHIVSQDDLNAINSLNTTHYGNNDDTYNLYKKFMADGTNIGNITRSTNIQSYLGLDKSVNREDFSQAINFVEQAILTKNEESTKSLLNQAKSLGLTWDELGKYEKGREYQERLKEKGISSYRVGTDSIPFDNYPALLHEGEAVLTASTANELRGLIDEYRATKEDNIKLEKAIQDQTEALVTRLDAIYNKIGNPDSDTSIMPRKFRQWKSNGR